MSTETEVPLKQVDRNSTDKTGRRLKSPAAYLIERELFVVQFQGLIVIDTADEIEGLQAAVQGANLHDVLVSPILSSLRSLIPTTEDRVVDSSLPLTADAALKQESTRSPTGQCRADQRPLGIVPVVDRDVDETAGQFLELPGDLHSACRVQRRFTMEKVLPEKPWPA